MIQCVTFKMMPKDTSYYDAESGIYSAKRYPRVVTTYVQSFYQSRLRTLTSAVRGKVRQGGTMIELGCADGVVTRALYDLFHNVFSEVVGVDISRGMIERAKEMSSDRNIKFFLREEGCQWSRYDLVVEVGVINYADAERELEFARTIVHPDGVYICSVAGRDSLWHRLKPEDKRFRNFLLYSEYEELMRKHFFIASTSSVGLFIPHIWKVPAVARIVQPLIELVLRRIAPNLFQEKVYVLRPLP